MLRVTRSQIDRGTGASEADFVLRLRTLLDTRHPGFLPGYSPAIADWVLGNLIARARAFGATWETSIVKLADMMIAIAPNVLASPEVYARIHPAYRKIGAKRLDIATDLKIKRFDQRIDDATLVRLMDGRTEIELYTRPALDREAPAKRAAFALALLTGITAQEALPLAEVAYVEAQKEGLGEHPDAALILAALTRHGLALPSGADARARLSAGRQVLKDRAGMVI